MAGKKKVSIESKLDELALAVDQLNSENTQLEDSIKIYMEAMGKIKELNRELEMAEQKVSSLLRENNQTQEPTSDNS